MDTPGTTPTGSDADTDGGDEATLGPPVPDGRRVRHPDRPHIVGTTFLRAGDVRAGDVVHHEGRWRLVIAVAAFDDPLHPDDDHDIEQWQCKPVNDHLNAHRDTVALMLAAAGPKADRFFPDRHEPVRVQVMGLPDGTTDPLTAT